MLSAKPWRADALIRLFASVLVCSLLLSTLIFTACQFFAMQPHRNALSFLAAISVALLLLIVALCFLSRSCSWEPENILRNLAAVLLCVYGGFFLSWLAMRIQGGSGSQPTNTTVRIVVGIGSFQGAALLLTHFFLRAHHRSWREGFGFNHQPGRALLLGACAVPVALTAQIIFSACLKALGIDVDEQEAVRILRSAHGLWEQTVMGIGAILIAPFGEEVLFRGLMYPAIKQAGFPRAAIWITSLLFAAIHVNLAIFIPLTLLALLLIWLYERTDNLLAPIAAHSLFNATNFVMLFVIDSIDRMPKHG